MTPTPKNVTESTDVASFATPDHGRSQRCGHGEVIYAAGKQPHEVVGITRTLLDHGQPAVLATRCDETQIEALREAFSDDWPIEVGTRSGTVIVGTPEVFGAAAPAGIDETKTPEASVKVSEGKEKTSESGVKASGGVVIVTGGTSDLAVAEEAAMTCRALGFTSRLIADVGVAGVHRVLNRVEDLRSGNCVIVVAGMEGALPSVVGGLVDVPVIAVPTSVGYGASFGGIAALLGMLNSCASGVTVVNIDNGFGAAYAACQIERVVRRVEV